MLCSTFVCSVRSMKPRLTNFLRWKSMAENNLTFWMNMGNSKQGREPALFDGRVQLLYDDLALIVARYSAFLRQNLRIQSGDRVLTRVDKSVDSLALYLATLKLGAIYVPVNPAYTGREMQYFVKDSEPKVLVTKTYDNDSVFAKKVEFVIESSILSSEVVKEKPLYDIVPVDEDTIACICYTSGTTGMPKGAMLSHKNLLWNARALIDLWKFTQNDVLLHCLPFYHVHGMFISLNCSMLSSSNVIFRPQFEVNDVIKYLPKSTVMMGVPTYYSRLLRNKTFSADTVKNMRLFISGSAPMSYSLWQDFRNRTGHCILERYGMTEAAVITSNLYETKERTPGLVGKVLPGGKLRISSKGIVEINLPSVFKGYWRNPEKTKSEFTTDGFFITGDLGRLDDKGRGKDLIISGGLNVYPKEVEDVLDADEAIKESAVIGVPHPDFGEAVIAVCVPRIGPANEANTSTEQLRTRLQSKLANYKSPKRFVFLDALPRNSLGKVQKNLLRKQYSNIFD